MLSKETLSKLAKAAGISESDLSKAIEATDEQTLELPEVTSFTKEEIEKLNKKNYEKGKVAGQEMAIKDMIEEEGLDVSKKDLAGFKEAFKAKVLQEAGQTVDEKVKAAEEKVKNLQATVVKMEKDLKDKDGEIVNIKTQSELLQHIPSFGDNQPALGKEEILSLMKANGYETAVEDGKTVWKKNGSIVADNKQNPVPLGDVVKGFLVEKKLMVQEQDFGGRGGGNRRPAAGFTKLSDITKKYESEGKSTLGEEFQAEVKKAQANNADFDLNS